jgi:FkbM family methyltransferase
MFGIRKRRKNIARNSLDPSELPALLNKQNPVILDIGCNDGRHTLMFLALFPAAKVYAFEPDPRARQRFRSLVTDSRAKLFDLAISSLDGTAEFFVSNGLPSEKRRAELPQGWDLSGSIKKPKDHLVVHPWCTFDERIQVNTTKLDTWCRDEGVDWIDFIWADVQGAEEDLILGGLDALKRTRYLYTEYSNRELYEGQIDLQTILKLLPEFEVVKKYKNDVLLRNKSLQ